MIVGGAQVLMALVLALFSAFLWKSTDKYAKITEKDLEMKERIRHIERLHKELDNIIGPLYSKMDDHTAPFFILVSHSSEGAPFYQEIFAFWRDIKKNIYLAPRDLQESLGNYLKARQKFRMAQKDTTTPGEESTAARTLFDKAIEDLKPKIENRYNELNKQLEEREQELEISGSVYD